MQPGVDSFLAKPLFSCFPKLNAMMMELLLTMKGVAVYIAEDGRPGGH